MTTKVFVKLTEMVRRCYAIAFEDGGRENEYRWSLLAENVNL